MEHISPWKRYVDDNIAVIKFSPIEHVLSILNSFTKILNLHMSLNKMVRLIF